MTLFNPILSTNSRAFYWCPADQAPAWNIAWSKANPGFGLRTNDLQFPLSYYYLHQFYNEDTPNSTRLRPRRYTEVKSPSKKALLTCYAEPEGGNIGARNIAHGREGEPLLFVDGHAAYVKFTSLNKIKLSGYGEYNLDWTDGGLSQGEDLR
jgi:hypothetical protein